MIRYPLEFAASAETANGMASTWLGQSGPAKLVCAVPTEFEGPGGGLSPEDLFAQALTNCFIASFKVFAHHSKLNFEKITTSSNLIVDLDENKKPVMKAFHLRAKIFSPSNKDRAALLAKKAFDSGFVINSVKTACSFEFEIIE